MTHPTWGMVKNMGRYLYKQRWQAWKEQHQHTCPHCKKDLAGVDFRTEVMHEHHTGGRCTVPAPIIIAS